jgi:Ca-activated chloride channel family protein
MVRPDLRLIGIGILTPLMLVFAQERDGPRVNSTVRVDVELVMVNVSVVDSEGQPVTGLKQEQFRVWEDKIEQNTEYFSSEEAPVSVGLIFDISGSMSGKLSEARGAALTFLKTGNLQDEHFLIEFSDRAQVTQGFTGDVSNIQRRLASTSAKGSTALFDAVYLGLRKVTTGMHAKKALLVITDGRDNRSRYTYTDLKEFAREQDVQVYSIGIMDGLSTIGYVLGMRPRIADLSEMTGARAFFPTSVNELREICAQIALELKNQYVIGYRSTNRVDDGRWRKLQVKVDQKEGLPRLTVRSRTGYYATLKGALAR